MQKQKDGARLRIFIVEAPSPMDLLQRRAESPALEEACALIGHEVTSFTVKSRRELEDVVKFIASIDPEQDASGRGPCPLCVHIAAHGNDHALGIGPDSLTWDDLLDAVQPLCKMPLYKGDVILVISACGACNQRLTKKLERRALKDEKFIPPAYLFVTAEEKPSFDDALVSWIVFYHQLPRTPLEDIKQVRAVLKKVKKAGATTLMYHRWNSERRSYFRHRPQQ